VLYVSHGTPVRSDGFQAFPPTDRAAEVTEVGEDDVVGLVVLNPTGLFFHPLESGGVPHDQDGRKAGTWHWPDLGDGAPVAGRPGSAGEGAGA